MQEPQAREQTLGEQASEIVELIQRADMVLDGVLGSNTPDAVSGGDIKPVVPPVGQSLSLATSRLRTLHDRLVVVLRDRVGMI